MAISRHDPEWQRVIAMAALAGVTFEQSRFTRAGKARRAPIYAWYFKLPDGRCRMATSKFNAAKEALYMLLGGAPEFLPDAATPQTAPSGPDGNRTEEFI